ncbi:hypothetical protein [Flavobacterium reichenbachii]|uniref:hypothetical protein n=1 Tax=Flavobacterium reichenbachii TaxID=362418 RepID=UPI00068DC0C7|nr:hypothetical protein [Flavobacterium reichenbachii]OXB14191.1 hypothetical protein B0A68_13285 [Flavobacterium reichenbachii]
MVKLLQYIIVASLLQSCNSKQDTPAIVAKKQATFLCKNSVFDLGAITFRENPSKLYAENIIKSDDVQYYAERDGKLTDEMLQYKISNTTTKYMEIETPKDFGFLYRSPELDSIAKFKSISFNSLSLLTNIDKKPIAFLGQTKFRKTGDRKKKLEEIKTKLGSPTHSFFVDKEFDQCAYEWVLSDRTIQIEISSGVTITFNTKGETKQETQYYLEILIVANKYKNDIYNAHKYKFPDEILYDIKYHSDKDLPFEKNNILKDKFLLLSSNDIYIKEEYGKYNIIQATDDCIIF